MEGVAGLEKEIADLRKILQEKETKLYNMKKQCSLNLFANGLEMAPKTPNRTHYGDKLPRWAIERYSRQILLPNIGVHGQEKLCDAKVLVVGVGGLGCPAAMYLAGAGIGEIGLIDYDTVDISNIHRQVLHSEADENLTKVESAANKLRSLNSHIKITPYNVQLNSSNARDIAAGYELILDCSDNVPTRYLLNDLSVMIGVPLISGSALKMEGQLTIYGYKDEKERGPCYRCIFPLPPPPGAAGSCSTLGVAGPIPATIGSLQALEAIKLIVGHSTDKLLVKRMLLFDGEDLTFRTVTLRGRNPQCSVCSETPTITELIDYEIFCNAKAVEKDLELEILPSKNRISAQQLQDLLNNAEYQEDVKSDGRVLMVDVRSEQEFSMCRIDGADSWPIDSLTGVRFDALMDKIKESSGRVVFLCRRGNDSQLVTQRVLDAIEDFHRPRISDLTGGLHAWAALVGYFPVY